MKRIPLTQGQFAIVDDEDFDDLNRYKWCAWWNPHTRSFYAVRHAHLPNGKPVMQSMHRHILGLEYGDKRQGDHINHDTLDNRRCSIRIVTPRQNRHNVRCRGYSWHKPTRKYISSIQTDGVQKHLGLFTTRSEARAAYLAAKHIYHPTAPIPTDPGEYDGT